jgi:hypothetical protein
VLVNRAATVHLSLRQATVSSTSTEAGVKAAAFSGEVLAAVVPTVVRARRRAASSCALYGRQQGCEEAGRERGHRRGETRKERSCLQLQASWRRPNKHRHLAQHCFSTFESSSFNLNHLSHLCAAVASRCRWPAALFLALAWMPSVTTCEGSFPSQHPARCQSRGALAGTIRLISAKDDSSPVTAFAEIVPFITPLCRKVLPAKQCEMR